MKRSSDGDDDGKFRAIRWIQIEEDVVRMLEVVEAIGPRIVVDATEASQKQQGSAVAGGGIVNYLTAMFGIHRNRLEPVRHPLAQIFLKKSLALDSIRIASQHQSPIAQKRQNEVSRAVVISQQVPLGVAGFGEIHFVQIAQTQPLPSNSMV